jgi:hypothetical protein
VVRPKGWSLRLPTAWPLIALFVLYPLWWALGVSSFVFVIFAVPMLVQLRRRGRPARRAGRGDGAHFTVTLAVVGA